jgi:molecular chaperone GrpE
MKEKKRRTTEEKPIDEAREVPIEDASTREPEKERMQELVDRIQRLQAEFENYKKRVAKETTEREDRATNGLLLDVLPLYDALQLAFENHNRDRDAEAFVSGVERIFAQFEQVLADRGVARIEAIGRPFDPAMHEALLSLPSEEEKNTIVEELSPGYVRSGRTLRASKVGVSQGPAAKEEEE